MSETWVRSGDPVKGSTGDATVGLADGLLLSSPVKPTQTQPGNENERPGLCGSIAGAAFIDTSNKRVTPPSGTQRTQLLS